MHDAARRRMKNHRAIWAIAGVAVVLALAAFGVRQWVLESPPANVLTSAERDRLTSRMIEALERDHRARFALTRELVEEVAAYCEAPDLATAETWYAQGLRTFYGELDTVLAGEAFDRARALRPEWAWPENGLGIVRFFEGQREEAQRHFERAEALAPGWSGPHAEQVILLRRAGDLKGALREAERALALEPSDLVNQFNYGVVLDDLGRHAEARSLYERVWAAAPDMAQAAYNLACSYAREGDSARAVPLLTKAIAGNAAFRAEILFRDLPVEI